eukprot:TRINITY_DN28375_c0_g1_i1.p1 TRINITY_DN28375_c0_g1~~TRINITY_DN28375_c0_g1_i1.p1  ORF type:complete len:841 (-),score=123.56 TRINITY_DN28375_c0_g1_i1:20-2542(-)
MIRRRVVALASAATAVDVGLGDSGTASAVPSQAPSAIPWHGAADFTYLPGLRGLDDEEVGGSASSSSYPSALCDVGALESVSCHQDVWKRLLNGFCTHCRDNGQCTSDHELAKLVDEVLRLYVSLTQHHGKGVVDDFSCKHGVLAAIVYESEYLGFEWRPPVAMVELLRTVETLDYFVSAEEHDRIDAIMEQRFRDGNISNMFIDPSAIKLTDVHGSQVVMQHGVPPVEYFPLHFSYRQSAFKREFVHLRRIYMTDATEGLMPVLVDLNLPIVHLAPFPFHTDKLRAMRQFEQSEYDQFVADVSLVLASRGIFHVVMPGDATTAHLSTIYDVEQSRYLSKRYSLDASEREPPGDRPPIGADGARLSRFSIFVPIEQRSQLVQFLWGPGDGPAGLGSHRKAVELGLGHIQIGEPAYHFASGLNFRIFCDRCLWVSIYLYATEFDGAPATILPLDFWLPCRILALDLFPVREGLLGGMPQVRVPYPRVEHPGSDIPNMGLLQVAQATPGVYRGTCRESLQRAIVRLGGGVGYARKAAEPGFPALPPVLPELLPMHDVGSRLGPTASLEFLMAMKQLHAAPGLEQYQDKIALSIEFQRRGLQVPRLFYSSYDDDFDVRPTLRRLHAASEPYVAKASHMCCSKGVYVMDDGFDHVSGEPRSIDEIQISLQHFFYNPFNNITPVCGDWGTVEAGKKPGVLVEELMIPSVPLGPLLKRLGGGRWTGPDIVACHFVWSTLLYCGWEIKLRLTDGEIHTEDLGMIFRDGSCLGCVFPQPFGSSWPATVDMIEGLLPHADYLRITLFVRHGRPVLNEIEYTCGGLEMVPLRIAREWTLRWLEGYHRYRS